MPKSATHSSAKLSSPAWVNDAIFYQIFPDRFRKASSYKALGAYAPWGSAPTAHNFMGGNLRGIIEGLDHIADLGCNAIYLCPIFSSTSNHRYHTNDYFAIDPILGTEQDFDDLVKAVHARKMRLVLDGVFNHCSRGLFQFNSLLECGADSPFRDWFHVDSFPLNAYGPNAPNYRCWWNLPALPKFNTGTAEVREFLWSVGEHWIKRGADGWRLDVPNEIDDDSFWQEFRRRVKAANPEAYIVGEIWEDPARWLAGDQFDGVMNYPARRAILETQFPEAMSKRDNLSTGEPESTLPAQTELSAEMQTRLAELLCEKLCAAYPADQFGTSLSLLGSHDNIRLATLGKSCEDQQSIAWALLLFLPGAPSIYAGDELGLEGGKDPDNRRCFPWDEFAERKKGWRFPLLQQLISLRKRFAALRHGQFGCCAEGQGILLWRELGAERLELRIAYPGTIGMQPSREVQWHEWLSHKVEPVSGVAGRVVQKGGWQIVQVHV